MTPLDPYVLRSLDKIPDESHSITLELLVRLLPFLLHIKFVKILTRYSSKLGITRKVTILHIISRINPKS
jgi:hypothetical protein